MRVCVCVCERDTVSRVRGVQGKVRASLAKSLAAMRCARVDVLLLHSAIVPDGYAPPTGLERARRRRRLLRSSHCSPSRRRPACWRGLAGDIACLSYAHACPPPAGAQSRALIGSALRCACAVAGTDSATRWSELEPCSSFRAARLGALACGAGCGTCMHRATDSHAGGWQGLHV